MRILVVEDNADLADSIGRSLQQMEHAVDLIGHGVQAALMLRTESYDLVVLDLNLPGRDGLDVLKELRESGSETPVLVLTARAEPEERVRGLDLGADDYLVKPFHLAELDARVRALLRRQSSTPPVVRLGPIAFDTVSREVELDGEPLALTPRERGLLEALLMARGRVLSKERIAEHLFSFDDEASSNAIELYVHRLRKKMARSGPGPRASIRTVRGLGYLLEIGK